ncbi:MAG TPA: glycosyltransferase family 4 protein [Candidatus Binatia bacterium]|nr:glycosyltransferase family 4 protein [Candidatus Binatia bacterium]
MRLLVVTFAMDDASPVLAWQQRLVSRLADRSDQIVVLTEQLGGFEQRANLEVVGVPRAFCRAPLRFLRAKWLMLPYLLAMVRNRRFDVCLVHMNIAWAYRLRPILTMLNVPIVMWYAHGAVSWRLRLALSCADRVVTSTPEGFRIPSAKVRVIGQAVDTDVFVPRPNTRGGHDVLYVGRISPRKRVDLVLEAFAALGKIDPTTPYRLRLIGPCVTREDRRYAEAVRRRAHGLGCAERIEWLGPIPMSEIAELYGTAFVHLNLSATGSMDKTVMEALACGCPVLTSNEAFRNTLAELPAMLVYDESPEAIARQLQILHATHSQFVPERLRALVAHRHDLGGHVDRIYAVLEEAAASRFGGRRRRPLQAAM